MPDQQLEESFIENFIVENKVERYLGLLENGKKREKFLKELYHFSGLDDQFAEVSPTSLKELIPVFKTCYAISANKLYDGKVCNLKDILNDFDIEGTILIFGDADAAVYMGEGPHNTWASKNLLE